MAATKHWLRVGPPRRVCQMQHVPSQAALASLGGWAKCQGREGIERETPQPTTGPAKTVGVLTALVRGSVRIRIGSPQPSAKSGTAPHQETEWLGRGQATEGPALAHLLDVARGRIWPQLEMGKPLTRCCRRGPLDGCPPDTPYACATPRCPSHLANSQNPLTCGSTMSGPNQLGHISSFHVRGCAPTPGPSDATHHSGG